MGIGYSFNNEKEDTLIKSNFKSSAFYPNKYRIPSLMRSKHVLRVVIENNEEEVIRYECDNEYNVLFEPTEIALSLHNPKEPADIRGRTHKTLLKTSPICRYVPHTPL